MDSATTSAIELRKEYAGFGPEPPDSVGPKPAARRPDFASLNLERRASPVIQGAIARLGGVLVTDLGNWHRSMLGALSFEHAVVWTFCELLHETGQHRVPALNLAQILVGSFVDMD